MWWGPEGHAAHSEPCCCCTVGSTLPGPPALHPVRAAAAGTPTNTGACTQVLAAGPGPPEATPPPPNVWELTAAQTAPPPTPGTVFRLTPTPTPTLTPTQERGHTQPWAQSHGSASHALLTLSRRSCVWFLRLFLSPKASHCLSGKLQAPPHDPPRSQARCSLAAQNTCSSPSGGLVGKSRAGSWPPSEAPGEGPCSFWWPHTTPATAPRHLLLLLRRLCCVQTSLFSGGHQRDLPVPLTPALAGHGAGTSTCLVGDTIQPETLVSKEAAKCHHPARRPPRTTRPTQAVRARNDRSAGTKLAEAQRATVSRFPRD
ncbi:hypothetical protein HJG60_008114 [Phyllostomus discolor]|uniref:Uncharacterized protein n=1 Tax=Phyllostomus discolor TaxID=89673 RepID=A0A833Z852_9CHIR|nr:hypothetical protein HJG60_008114 [Phyllostomus discolor]